MKSWIEISAAALRANYAALQTAAGPDFQLLCVIKANAYGHGAHLCSPVLVEAGAHWLGVGDLEEGIRVRHSLLAAGLADRNTHILVMCGFEPGDAPSLVEHHLTPVLWTPEHVQALEGAAAILGNERFPVHVELDTGMARQGATPGRDLAALLHALRAAPHLRVEGIFSHLSSSEVVSSIETTKQVSRFGAALEQIFEDQQVLPEFLHLGNSSAIDEGSTLPWVRDFGLNEISATPLVRPGLALYGYTLPLTTAPGLSSRPTAHLHPSPQPPPSAQPPSTPQLTANVTPFLHPVATWKTRIIGLRDLAPGDTVGYGATFASSVPTRVALLPIGYADGFRREASSGRGNGWVTVNDQRAPVLGRVSMNLTVVDVTHHTPQPTIGDEVILLGPGVTAHDHARWADTIPYEILCGMRGHRRLI